MVLMKRINVPALISVCVTAVLLGWVGHAAGLFPPAVVVLAAGIALVSVVITGLNTTARKR
jgi:hypothetical protein